jgi:hypothetical protein
MLLCSFGYSADDPPVQYLLEALNSKADHFGAAYAFQAGKPNEAAARWSHKGVKAIAYSEEDKHIDLWDTLEAWAARARSPDTWHSNVIEAAKLGPAKLQPYERGHLNAAKRELKTWPVNDQTIFSRLRIWASGIEESVSDEMFRLTIADINDEAFWSSYHQRDLLLILTKRWGDLWNETRGEIEARILMGPPRWG